MRGMFNQKRPDANAVRNLKKIVAEQFELPDDTTLSVAELNCHERGCPPTETVITARSPDGTTTDWRVAKAIADIRETDINNLLKRSHN
jgi:hypothetical protein